MTKLVKHKRNHQIQKYNQCMQTSVLILILKLMQLWIKELHISFQSVSVTHGMFWEHLMVALLSSWFYDYIWNVIY